MHRIAEGDQNAFRELFEQYWDNIYGVAYLMTKDAAAAKDIVQEVFVKLWMQRSTLAEKDDFRSFVFIVARNHIFNELRNRKRQEAVIEQLKAYFEERLEDTEHQVLHKESTELIYAAVESLSQQQKEIYLLSREKGWRRQDIADHLGISVSTVKTHLSRALDHIREHLERHAGSPIVLLVSVLRALL